MERKQVDSFSCHIHMAGDVAQAKHVCRKFCFALGLCVTIQPQLFVYTGGEEEGFVVGLLVYPRFPTTPEDLLVTAHALAEELLIHLCQHSYLIYTPTTTEWVSRRDENKAAK